MEAKRHKNGLRGEMWAIRLEAVREVERT